MAGPDDDFHTRTSLLALAEHARLTHEAMFGEPDDAPINPKELKIKMKALHEDAVKHAKSIRSKGDAKRTAKEEVQA